MRLRSTAWVLAFAAALAVGTACGSAADAPDATPASTDAGPPPDARIETITAIVKTDTNEFDVNGFQVPVGMPRPNTDVYFVEPSEIIHKVVTDGDGVATSPPVPAGTSMIVARTRSAWGEYSLTIYRSLTPGAVITVGPPADKPFLAWQNDPMLVSYTPLVSDQPLFYSLTMACSSNFAVDATTFQVGIFTECDRTDRTALLVASDSTGQPIAYAARQLDLVPGTTVAMPALRPAETFIANLSTIDSVPLVQLQARYRDRPDDRGPPVERAVQLSSFYEVVDDSNSGTVVEVPVTPAGDQLVLTASLVSDVPGVAPCTLSRTVDFPLTSSLVDLGAHLPFVDAAGLLDPATGVITWGEDGTRRADAAFAGGTYFVPEGSFGQLTVTYRIFGPHVPGRLTFPAMPAELDQIAPHNAVTWSVNQHALVDVVGSPDFESLAPTIDADARLIFPELRFGDARDVWYSGVAGGF